MTTTSAGGGGFGAGFAGSYVANAGPSKTFYRRWAWGHSMVPVYHLYLTCITIALAAGAAFTVWLMQSAGSDGAGACAECMGFLGSIEDFFVSIPALLAGALVYKIIETILERAYIATHDAKALRVGVRGHYRTVQELERAVAYWEEIVPETMAIAQLSSLGAIADNTSWGNSEHLGGHAINSFAGAMTGEVFQDMAARNRAYSELARVRRGERIWVDHIPQRTGLPWAARTVQLYILAILATAVICGVFFPGS